MSGLVEDGVIDKLQGTASVSALVGTRVYPRMAPADPTRPYIVVTLNQGQQPWHHSGASSGKAVASIGTACYGDTYAVARTLSETVELALDAQRGTFGAVSVSHCLLRDQYDASQNPIVDDEVGYPCVINIFEVCYTRPTA